MMLNIAAQRLGSNRAVRLPCHSSACSKALHPNFFSALFQDPFRPTRQNRMVLCDCWCKHTWCESRCPERDLCRSPDKRPLPSNTRIMAQQLFDVQPQAEPWFSVTQVMHTTSACSEFLTVFSGIHHLQRRETPWLAVSHCEELWR
eukprot:768521-Hanusia_phi.AAC.4